MGGLTAVRRALALVVATVALLAVAVPAASAVDRVAAINSNGPGPDSYDRSSSIRWGRRIRIGCWC